MALDRPPRRMPLRDLITDAEKRNRALVEQLAVQWMQRAGDLHDVSRPVRRKTNFPTLLTLQNALNGALQAGEEAENSLEVLMQELEAISEHGRRERLNRI